MAIIKKNLKSFYNHLEHASIKEQHKDSLKFAIEFMESKHEVRLATRSYLFHGEPGVGKTYLVEQILKIFNIPIIAIGCAEFSHPKLVKYETLKDIIKEIEKHESCVIFIDDLSYLFRFNDFAIEEEASEVRQQLMKLTDIIKTSNKRVLLFITANHIDLAESIIDRIEENIEVEIPGEANKLNFLKKQYSDLLKIGEIKHLSKHSIGYNYRDLCEIVKKAYRHGKGAINAESLERAMKDYIPSALRNLNVIPNVKTNFSNVVGRESIKTVLKHIIMTYKKQHLAESLGLKRHNLLIFEGSPGTGKTLMVEALAGEMQLPIIHYKSRHFYNEGLGYSLERLKTLCNRFKNSIIVIDEADKLVGKYSMDEDGFAEGHLNEIFEGLSSNVNSLVIVIVNNINRFGAGLRDRFTTISFKLPSYHERLEFCSRKLGTVEDKLSCEIDLEEVARLTANMSFRDIEKLWNQAFFKHLEEEKGLRTETFTSLIKEMDKQDNYSQMYG